MKFFKKRENIFGVEVVWHRVSQDRLKGEVNFPYGITWDFEAKPGPCGTVYISGFVQNGVPIEHLLHGSRAETEWVAMVSALVRDVCEKELGEDCHFVQAVEDCVGHLGKKEESNGT